MSDDEFLLSLAKAEYCPTIAVVARFLEVPVDDLIAKLEELAAIPEKLDSCFWDEILPEHDLSVADLPVIRAAFGK